MYYHLIKNNVKIPKTAFLKKKDICNGVYTKYC